MKKDLLQKIDINPKICHGKPIIKGTRIMVSVILENLAEGLSFEEIIENYPSLTIDDIKAAILFASKLSNEEIIVLNEN
jgi:uncharacterized protein (DUF433 family)